MLANPIEQSRADSQTAAEFLELVLADEQLLRQEFDAIIAQEWATCPPPGVAGAASPSTGPRPRRRLLPRGGRTVACTPRHPGVGGRRWQRSTPARLQPGARATETERHRTS